MVIMKSCAHSKIVLTIISAANRGRQTGAVQRGPQTVPDSFKLDPAHQSYSSLASLTGSFSTEISQLFCFVIYAADAHFRLMHNYLKWLLCSLVSRAPQVVLFNLKPLIEGSNLQVYIYCVNAQKRSSGAPRTHFRACKIATFSGGIPPDPPRTIHIAGPHFLSLPWARPILLAALTIITRL